MELAVVIPLAAFVALASVFVVLLRRAGRLIATTRDVERFRRQVADLAARVETSFGEVSTRIDALRRGQLSAQDVTDDLAASIDAAARYTAEARAFRPPYAATGIRDGVVDELERAGRALEMIEHGCAIQSTARAGSRELESQTAIKRGYLNILHAREAIARHAGEAAALVPSDPANRRPARRII
jgi:hypothetical protein